MTPAQLHDYALIAFGCVVATMCAAIIFGVWMYCCECEGRDE